MPRVSQKKEVKKTTKEKILVTKKTTPNKKIKPKTSIIIIQNNTKKKVLAKENVSILSELNNTVSLKKRSKIKTQKNTEVVVLPDKVDKKLFDQIDFYKKNLSRFTPNIFRYTAYSFGFIFIFTGLLLCFSIVNINDGKKYYLTALLSCTDNSDCLVSETNQTLQTNTELTESNSESSYVLPQTSTLEPKTENDPTATLTEPLPETVSVELNKPEVEFLNEIPSNPIEDFDISIKTTFTESVRVFLESDFEKIELKSDTNNNYRVYINKLKPTFYKVRVVAKSLYDDSKYYFSGKDFNITKPEEESVILSNEIKETTNEVHEVNLRLNNFEQKNFLLQINNVPEVKFIEVYLRPKFSKIERFFGLAKKREEGWVFAFENTELPNGTYEIFIKYPFNDKTNVSETITFLIENEEINNLVSDTDIEKADPILITEKIKRDIEDMQIDINEDGDDDDLDKLLNKEIFYQTNSFAPATQTKDIASTSVNDLALQITKESNLLLNKNADKISKLLKIYATTLQGRDEKLTKIAEYEIEKFRNSIAIEVGTDLRTKDISDKVIIKFDEEILKLKNRVKKFEKLTSERSELISKDSDLDGISDFDETNLYNTDINNPDTDKDSILDGIEIVKGFDPLNSEQEAVIEFHSPKEFDYIDDKILKIDSINSIIETDPEQGGVPVLAEIKGKALPKSYVTLFIFSTPNIVTIKTDDNGDFVYIFEKELEDGEHEVYVAVTDNKGEIIARSNSFKFTKTAEAFSPVDAKNSEFVVNETKNETMLSSYNIVASMGVVSFGIILLMLGRTLKKVPDEKNIITNDTSA